MKKAEFKLGNNQNTDPEETTKTPMIPEFCFFRWGFKLAEF